MNNAVAILLSVTAMFCIYRHSAAAPPVDPSADGLEQAILRTDSYIANSRHYLQNKLNRINMVKDRLSNADSSHVAKLMIEVGREYRRYNVDSAAAYFSDAMRVASNSGDGSLVREATLELAAVNPLRGIIKESVDMLEQVDKESIPRFYRLNYFDKGFDVYVTTAAYYADKALGRQYLRKALAFSDSLVRYHPSGSAHQLYHKGWSAMNRGDMATALAELRAALSASEFGHTLYARVAASLADYYQNYAGDADQAAFYLALSAMSDIAAGTKETTSLQRLGLDLYRRGDISRAYNYLTKALDNSIESGSKIRTLAEINTLPVVTKAYKDKDVSRIRWLYALVGVLSVAMIALVVMVWLIYRSKRRISDYRSQLATTNMHKDAYISQILAICSSYIERIEDLNRLIVRKVKTGQGQDLCRMVESGEMMREQSDKFLRSFDEAFLTIYPDFVDRLNGLLRHDARFGELSEKRLTPELRIAAFMRLGVDESARIARLLGLSLNTVYTYRNKLRNRAEDRENFESNIKRIGSFAQF